MDNQRPSLQKKTRSDGREDHPAPSTRKPLQS
jgi:hypothetical protein